MGAGPNPPSTLTALSFLVAIVLGFVVLIFCLITAATAHENGEPNWITEGSYRGPDGVHCCGPNDCERLDPRRVKQTPAGYILLDYGNEVVPYSEAPPSEDGKFWRCHKWDEKRSRRCFFAPYGGS